MLYASDEERAAFNSGEQKQLILYFSDGTVITNDDISVGSMTFEQSICDEEQLIYGATSSARFTVKVMGTTKHYKDLRVSPIFKAEEFERPLGQFTVVSDTATSDKLYRQLECYDDLQLILQTDYSAWYNLLNFPMTLKQFRDTFFNYVAITQRNVVLINDDIEITKNFVADGYSGLDIIKNICEINACFGYLDYDNKFRYVYMTTSDDSLYPANDLYPDTDLYPKDWISERITESGYSVLIDDSLYPKVTDLYPSDSLYPKFRRKEMVLGNSYLQGSLKYEEYNTKVITQIQIRHTENDVGAVVGVEGNTYIIENNPLLYGKSTEELTKIGERFLAIVPISYVPASVKVRAMLWHELGDIVNIVSKNRVITLPILTRKITGITAALDEYSAKGTETYNQNANSTNRSLQILNQRTNELIRTVDETISEIKRVETKLDGDVEELSSRITQTAEKFETEITKVETKLDGEVEKLSSRITQTIDSISLSVDNGASTAGITISLNDGAGHSKTSDVGTINMNGLVTFNNINSSISDYVTTIDGGKISTNTISADKITVDGDGYSSFSKLRVGNIFEVGGCIRAVKGGDFYAWTKKGWDAGTAGYSDYATYSRGIAVSKSEKDV